MSVEPADLESADILIRLALDEDLGRRGDLTSQALLTPETRSEVRVVSRQSGRLCGAVLIERIYAALAERSRQSAACDVRLHCQDGDVLEPDTCLATISGSVPDLLTGERTVLNFLTHLSGIATLTASFVQQVQQTGVVILDTRKTLPGWRRLQKYAVRCGGGTNHRFGLDDGILIKDNHLAARSGQDAASAVREARGFLQSQNLSFPVEIEVDTLQQLRNVLDEQPDIVLLDNMTASELKTAVRMRDEQSPRTLLEASGGITGENVGCAAASGVDRISIGGLTHSVPALDIGYDWPETDFGNGDVRGTDGGLV